MRSNYRAARRGRSRAEFRAKLGTVFEEADECVDCLEYFRDANISHDAALIEEARELAVDFRSVSEDGASEHRAREQDSQSQRPKYPGCMMPG